MSKRKRDPEDNPPPTPSLPETKDLHPQRKYIEAVLERSTLLLTRALKLARGFERQKLGRRQKIAKENENEDDGRRLVSEVAALKALDLSTTAEVHLYKTILKAPTIASAPALPVFVKVVLEEKSRTPSTAQANVQARLFNSGAVKKVVDECLGSLRTALGVDEPGGGKRKRMRRADYQKESTGKETSGEDGGLVGGINRTLGRDEKSEVEAERNLPLIEFDQGSGSDSGSDYGHYESRLAGSSSDESSSDGDLDSSDYDKIRQSNNNQPSRADLSLSLSPVPSQPNDPSVTPVPHHHPPLNQPTSISPSPVPSPKPNTKTKTTTFLPSLSLTGYISPHSSRSPSPSPSPTSLKTAQNRKNRRGQRERRLIAEKKHGSGARHVSLHGSVRAIGDGGDRARSKGRGGGRDVGWDGRKGAVGVDGSGSRRGAREGVGRGGSGGKGGRGGVVRSSGANSDPVVQKRRLGMGTEGGKGGRGGQKAEEQLHPSWQAAKSKKDAGKVAEWKGKKVVFD